MLNNYLNDIENDYVIKQLVKIEKSTCMYQELKMLVEQISTNYGGDDRFFLKNYINDLINHDSPNHLEKALICFRKVALQIPSIISERKR